MQTELGGAQGERAQAVARYAAEKKFSAVKVCVVLARELSICKSLDLPAPGHGALEGIVKFEIEKHLPMATGEAYYSHEVMGKNSNGFQVVAGAASKRQVDELIGVFSSAGLVISFAGFWHEAVLNFLAHFGEIGNESKKIFIGTCGHESTIDAFDGLMPVYSKLVPAESVFQGLGFQRELANMSACLKSGPDAFEILSTDTSNADIARLEGIPGKMRLLDPGGTVEAPYLVAFGGALGAIGSGKCSINLMKGPGAEKSIYAGSAVFAAVALVLICLVGISYAAKDMMTLKRLDSSIARLKALKGSSSAEYGLAQSVAGIPALEAIPGARSQVMLDLLKEITEILPDDSWLMTVEYNNGSVILEGHSGDASSLLIRLEDSKYLGDFEFAAPVVRVSKNKEKFRIKARFKGVKEGKA
ncbi:hypothetical protein BAC1_01576 [uncultured bacterium]|nr:hypothetical protein BAC1_01576 [uncultured bacterium]